MLGTPNVDRQARRRLETRREILAAAWDLVGDGGWDALTLRAVAERVGMRAPSLYTHFASKLDIVDAMFGQAWADIDVQTAAWEEAGLPAEAHTGLEAVATRWLRAMTDAPERNALMNHRPVPGFVPSEESYAAAVSVLQRTHRLLERYGITDPDAADLWTALMTGLVSQQNANDPGGDRWRRLVPRAVRMYLAEVAPDQR